MHGVSTWRGISVTVAGAAVTEEATGEAAGMGGMMCAGSPTWVLQRAPVELMK